MESAIADKFASGGEPLRSLSEGSNAVSTATDAHEGLVESSHSLNQPGTVRLEADSLLQARCLACFGGKRWGASLEE